MKRNSLYICLCSLFCLAIMSCSKEDELFAEPDDRTSYFLPSPDATDEISVLRRSFYENEGSYLLFNDTLRHEPLGIDFNGDMKYFTETIDLGYSVGAYQNSSIEYDYEYLASSSDMFAAVSFLEESILPHLSAPLRPFSWFVTYSITQVTSGNSEPLNALSGERCIAVAVGNLSQQSAEEKDKLSRRILSTVMSSMLVGQDDKLNDFYAISADLYNTSFSMNDYTSNEENMQILKGKGFITTALLGTWVWRGRCPSKENDLKSFIDLIFNTPEEEVRTEYAEAPIVLQKYEVLKGLFNSLGYID